MGRVRLKVLEGPLAGRVVDFEGRPAVVVGRGARAGLAIDGDPFLATHHFVIQLDPPPARVRDVGGVGTAVNGVAVGPGGTEVRSGDRVRAGTTVIELDDLPSPAGPARVRCVARCGAELVVPDEAAVFGSGPWLCDPCRAALARAPEMPPGYRIVSRVGEGGMGAVFLAWRVADGQPVAIKTLKPELAKDERARRTFLREARLGGEVDHPNAVRLLESGEVNGQFFFVMEYVHGRDLVRHLAAIGRPLTVPEAHGVAAQVLAALEEAHGRKLVHRDVKPSNVLVTPLPGGLLAKLTDFGLVRSFERSGFTLTRTGEGKGTPAFMAPEQLENAKLADPRADLYSVGATVFYMLAGEPPLEPLASNVLTILEGRVKRLRDLAPAVPPALEAVLVRCLAKKPEDRFESARELGLALARAVGAPAGS